MLRKRLNGNVAKRRKSNVKLSAKLKRKSDNAKKRRKLSVYARKKSVNVNVMPSAVKRRRKSARNAKHGNVS